jgi:subtilisin family serine protease
MWSIDIPGDAGYNPWHSLDDINPPPHGEVLPSSGWNYNAYTGRMGGTSHSCPVVAGVAALVLSVNPNITNIQLFDIFTHAATEKNGPYNYTDGWSKELGFGRINAKCAVFHAQPEELSGTLSGSATYHRYFIHVENAIVQNGEIVPLTGTEITIDGPFEVEIGAELEINIVNNYTCN